MIPTEKALSLLVKPVVALAVGVPVLVSLGLSRVLACSPIIIIIVIIRRRRIYIALFSYPIIALYNDQVNVEPKS